MAPGPPHSTRSPTQAWQTSALAAAACLLCLAEAASAQRVTQATGFSTVIATRREDSRLFYQAVYKASNGLTLAWTGDTATCRPGTTNDDYTVSGQRRLNYFRALAGIPPTVSFLPQLTALAQKAALMYLANAFLVQQGKPMDPTWTCFTADGNTAAKGGNLIRGGGGAFAVDYWINDTRIANLGHRRVLLYPNIQNAGQGNVGARPGRFESTASSLYVDRSSDLSKRPTTRDEYVAWPPRGFVPYSLIPPDWSFSHPIALFNKSSTVTLTYGTTSIPLLIFIPNQMFGDPNVIIFTPLITSPLPSSGPDTTYVVTITKAFVLSGKSYAATSHTYSVTAFDPSINSANTVVPKITGPTKAKANTLAAFNFVKLPILSVDSYEFRSLSTVPATWTDGAEQGTLNFAVNTSVGYTATTSDIKGRGSSSFHLAHPINTLQTLTFLQAFYVPSATASLNFSSQLGAATASQIAQVQVSVDEGVSWTTVWSQPGTGVMGELSFSAISAPLSTFVGSIIRIRFAYVFNKAFGLSYFNQVQAGVGWYIDDISLQGVSTATAATSGSVGPTASRFTASFPSKGRNVVQVRAAAFGNYALDWGPTFAFDVV